MHFFRSTLLLIPDLLDQASVCLYPSNLTVFIFVVTRFLCSLSRAKKICNDISTRFGKKIKEVFAIDIAGSILVQKYHAEFGEAVDINHYTEISNSNKLQVIVVEAKPTRIKLNHNIYKQMKHITVLCLLKLKRYLNRGHISCYRYMFASVASSFHNIQVALEINVILV